MNIDLDGKKIWVPYHSLISTIKVSKKYNLYSYITARPGQYRADVMATDGKTIIKTLFFKVEGNETVSLPENPEATFKITLKDSQLCERVEKKTPVNPTTSFKEGPVYVWVETEASEAPTKIFYRWSSKITGIDGTQGWKTDLHSTSEITGKKWRTYLNRNCAEGDWKVDILSSDGKTVLKTYEFSVSK